MKGVFPSSDESNLDPKEVSSFLWYKDYGSVFISRWKLWEGSKISDSIMTMVDQKTTPNIVLFSCWENCVDDGQNLFYWIYVWLRRNAQYAPSCTVGRYLSWYVKQTTRLQKFYVPEKLPSVQGVIPSTEFLHTFVVCSPRRTQYKLMLLKRRQKKKSATIIVVQLLLAPGWSFCCVAGRQVKACFCTDGFLKLGLPIQI